MPRLAMLSLLLAPPLSACAVVGIVEPTPAPLYSRASPYAPQATDPATVQPLDGYCAEAINEAQDAAALASASGRGLDTSRAARAAAYARRDC